MIRKAELKDIKSICVICNSQGLSPGEINQGELYKEWFEELLNSENKNKVLFYVSCNFEEVTGFILGEPLLCKGMKLWMLGVSENLQGRGTGIRLLDFFENQCLNRGFTWINAEGFEKSIPRTKAKKLGYETNENKYHSYYKSLI